MFSEQYLISHPTVAVSSGEKQVALTSEPIRL